MSSDGPLNKTVFIVTSNYVLALSNDGSRAGVDGISFVYQPPPNTQVIDIDVTSKFAAMLCANTSMVFGENFKEISPISTLPFFARIFFNTILSKLLFQFCLFFFFVKVSSSTLSQHNTTKA